MRLSSFRLPVERLSATALTEFLTCAELFRLKRIVRTPERNRLDRFIGRVHHSTVAANFKQKVSSGVDLDEETMWAHYSEIWSRTLEEDGEPEWTTPPSEAFETGSKVLACFQKEVAPLVSPIRVEEWFEERIPGIPVPIVGYIDVESHSFIEEFKTSARKEARPKPRWRFQGRVYQLYVDKPVVWYVTTKQVTPKAYTPLNCPELLMEPANRDQTVRLLVQTVEVLNDMYARYGPSTPWATNGLLHEWACKSGCSYGPVSAHPICPAWRNHDSTTT